MKMAELSGKAGVACIGTGVGLLAGLPVDAFVNGPMSRATERTELDESADRIEDELGFYLPEEREDVLAYAEELRDSGPKEWFPYDVGVEAVGFALTGILAVAAVREVLRSRRRSAFYTSGD